MEKLNTETFLEFSNSNAIIDVRSPIEYTKGHIPGAINIPLFSDEERSEIGALYKQKGRDQAVQIGLDFVGPRMSLLVNKCRELKYKDHLLVHCWRGGMRSESFAWLMNTSGMNCAVLEGGYKSYRNYILQAFTIPLKLALLAGSTGCGKTEILQQLEATGEQIIDLEALACHKGSVFGGLGQNHQPSTEQFQNNLFNALRPLNTDRRIWVEDESIGIGDVHIPQEFWVQMTKSPFIRIELDKQERIKRLVHEYGLFSIEQLESRILKISKRLGGMETQNAIRCLNDGGLEEATDQLLKYYDKAYNNCIDRKKSALGRTLNYDSFEIDVICKNLIEEANKFTEIDNVYE